MKLVRLIAPMRSKADARSLADRMNLQNFTLVRADGKNVIVNHVVDDDGSPLSLKEEA